MTTLELLRSKMWLNERFKAVFHTKQTANSLFFEYYWFTFDFVKGLRRHHLYRVVDNKILINQEGKVYGVRELTGVRKYNLTIVQFTNIKDDMDYFNMVATDIPATKGMTYNLEKK